MVNEETTYYRFLSEIKYFLGQLMEEPIKAQPSEYLKERGFYKTRLINLLLKRDVLERHEDILFPNKTGHEYPEYSVKYLVKRKNFERIIKRIFSKYFEKNEPIMINECDCGACCGGEGDASFLDGATNAQCSGQYVGKFGSIQRRSIYGMPEKKKEDKNKPENILGKTIQAESKKPSKKIKFTQKQIQYILETTTATAGDYQYTAPFPADKESADRTPGFSCKTV